MVYIFISKCSQNYSFPLHSLSHAHAYTVDWKNFAVFFFNSYLGGNSNLCSVFFATWAIGENFLIYSIYSHNTHLCYNAQVYISQCFGTYQVGFTLIVLGVSSAVMSIIYSRLLKYLPRFLIVLFGVALSVSTLLFMLLWERVPSYYAIFAIAVGWGAADAVWTTMPTSRCPLNKLGCFYCRVP